MKELIVCIILGLPLVTYNSFGQIPKSEKDILIETFTDKRIYNEVFTNKYDNKNFVYIYETKQISSHIDNDEKVELDKSSNKAGVAVLVSTENGSIGLLSDGVRANAVSKFKIDKIVVIEKFNIRRGKAELIFHTSNLDPKFWMKINNPAAKFYRFKCSLVQLDYGWILENVRISDMPFKEVK